MDGPLRVLLVEDNPGDQRLIREMLREVPDANIELQTTGTLAEGLTILAEQPFDAVLLDLSLPDSTGMDTFDAVHAAAPLVPTLLLTGGGDAGMDRRTVRAGAQDYLVKGTVRGTEIVRAIGYAIERTRVAAEMERQRLLLARAENMAQMGSWRIELDSGRVTWSEEMYRIFGLGPSVLGEDMSAAFAAAVHPDDREDVAESSASTLAEHVCHPKDYRIVRPDGNVRWVHAEGQPVLDESGETIAIVGFLQDITEQREAEIALRSSEEKYATAFRASPDAINLTRISDGLYIEVNEGFTRLLGYSPEDVRGRTSIDLDIWWDPADRAHLVGGLRRSGYVENMEVRFRHKNGTQVTALVSGRIMMLDGEECLLSITRDISEIKATQDALAESESRYRELFDKMLEGFAYCRMEYDESGQPVDWEYLAVNDAFVRITELEGVVGKKVSEVIPDLKHDSPELFAAYGRVAAGGDPEEFEFDFGTLNLWLHVSTFSPLPGHFVAVFEDISERKRVQAALDRERDMLANAESSAHMGSWRLSRLTGEVEWSAEMFRIFGLDPATFGGTALEAIEGRVHPDDRAHVEEIHRAVMGDGVPRTSEYRVIDADGRVRWVHAEGRAECDTDGNVVALNGFAQDITESKEAEEAVRDSEATLRSFINSVPEPAFVVDRDGCLLVANTAMTTLTGHPIEDLLGKSHPSGMMEDVVSPRLGAAQEVFRTGKSSTFEESHRGKDYVTFVSPIMSPDGSVSKVAILSFDITERKRAEAAMAASEARYRLIAENASDVIWTLDVVEGRFSYVSPSVERLTGFTPDEVLEMSLAQILTPESYQIAMSRIGSAVAAIAAGDDSARRGAIEVEAVRKDGSTVWIEVSTTYLGGDPAPTSLLGVCRDIGERRRLDHELRSSEERYRSIFNNAVEGIFVATPAGRWVSVNPAFAKMLGYTSAEDAIARVYDIAKQHYVYPEDRNRFLQALEEHDRVEEFVIEAHDVNGRRLRVSMGAHALRDEEGRIRLIEGTTTDITESWLAEERLRQSETRFRTLTEEAPMAIAIARGGEFVYANPMLVDTFGFESAEKLVGTAVLDRIAPGDQESFSERLDALEAEEIFESSLEVTCITADGSEFPGLVAATTAALADGRAAIMFVQDLTEHQRVERLRVARDAAEEASRAKGSFLANMSHEIRTPMNAILGFTQLMRDDPGLSKLQRQRLDTINRSGEYLLTLINDVLEMSKIEAGRVVVTAEAFDTRELLRDLETMFRPRMEAQGLTFAVEPAPDLPQALVTDAGKLRQILINLLGNSVKFTETGSVTLRMRTFTDPERGSRLVAEVEDTGIGIAEEDVARLFHLFEQAHSPRAGVGGTGLGLAISREYARLLGGDIELESELGAGSVFRVDVAVASGDESAVPAKSDDRRVVGLAEGEPAYRLLIADDVEDNRDLLSSLLGEVGFETLAVANGKEAVDAFTEWKPDLTLMDLRMPIMSGQEAMRRIRESEGGERARILAVTASAFSEVREEVMSAGADDFVGKPYRENELLRKVGALLGVSYVYAAESPDSRESSAFAGVDASSLAAVPDDLSSEIRVAVTRGDFERVIELVDEAPDLDPRFAEMVREAAEAFDSGRILELLGE